MRKITFLLLFLIAGLCAFAQRPSIDTSVYHINENDVKRFIVAQKSINLTQEDYIWMDSHPYESNQNAEVYMRIKKGISAAGFKDYLEYTKVTQRVVIVYAYHQQGGISEEQEQQLEEAVNNPNIPEEYRASIQQQVEAIRKQKPTDSEVELIKLHQKELDDLLAKFQDEG